MKTTNQFFLQLLPAALYRCEHEEIIWGVAEEGATYIYNLMEYFFQKTQNDFVYQQEDIEVYHDCTTYDELVLVKIELKHNAEVHKVHILFEFNEDEGIHNKLYYATVEVSGQTYCGAIGEDGRLDVCLEPLTTEEEEMQYIVEDYFAYWY